MGCCGDQAITRQWSARGSQDAALQRHRGMGNDEEVTRVQALLFRGVLIELLYEVAGFECRFEQL